jgi:phosphomannomutase/phosphoglucomutase
VAEIYRRQRQIVDVDGVRVPFEEGWGLVRASNTQPILVMRFEATNKELLERYKNEVEQTVEQAKAELGI